MGPAARRYDWAVAVMAEKMRQGKEVPPPIRRTVESRPPLFPWLQIDLEAFWHLCRTRPVHFGGIGYITDDAIDTYLRLFQLDLSREQREDFVRNILVCDQEYMKIADEKRKADEQLDAEKDRAQPKNRR